eukprot:2526413-Amphidinium_carterae.1
MTSSQTRLTGGRHAERCVSWVGMTALAKNSSSHGVKYCSSFAYGSKSASEGDCTACCWVLQQNHVGGSKHSDSLLHAWRYLYGGAHNAPRQDQAMQMNKGSFWDTLRHRVNETVFHLSCCIS